MLKDKNAQKRILEVAIPIFGLGIVVNIFSNKVQDELNEIAQKYFPKLPHAEFYILIGATLILVTLYVKLRYFNDEEKKPVISESIEDRKILIESLIVRYKKRLEKKMDADLGLTIQVVLEYTKEGTSEEYVSNYFIENYEEGAAGDFDNLFKRYTDDFKRLLIIGEPGSGKTVLLLNFALDLLAIAEANANYPIPVLLNLSSWRKDNVTFDDWLEKNLVHAAGEYGTSKEHAKQLANSNNLLLLLDGLDEMPADHRSSFLAALSGYHTKINRARDNEYPEYIVCCRREEYKLITNNAPVSATVAIKDLSPEKVHQELLAIKEKRHSRGTNADLLLRILDRRPELVNYLTTAFYLHIALNMADRNYDFTVVTSQRRLLADYIESELKNESIGYPVPKAKKYLGWLSYNLNKSRKGITFELIDIEANWSKKISLSKILIEILSYCQFTIAFSVWIGKFSIGVMIFCLILPALSLLGQDEVAPLEIRKFDLKKVNWSEIVKNLITVTPIILVSCFALDYLFHISKSFTVPPFYLAFALIMGQSIDEFFQSKKNVIIKSKYQRLFAPFAYEISRHFIVFFITYSAFIFFHWVKNLGYIEALGKSVFISLALTLLRSDLLTHFNFRIVFTLTKLIPLKFVTFLDKIANTGLMETDGAQWRFRHQIIQDYFRSNYQRTMDR